MTNETNFDTEFIELEYDTRKAREAWMESLKISNRLQAEMDILVAAEQEAERKYEELQNKVNTFWDDKNDEAESKQDLEDDMIVNNLTQE